jgi:hypothetical protein
VTKLEIVLDLELRFKPDTTDIKVSSNWNHLLRRSKLMKERTHSDVVDAKQAVSSSEERDDCPGKIVCPLTGQLICKDRCPLGVAEVEEQSVESCCCESSS